MSHKNSRKKTDVMHAIEQIHIQILRGNQQSMQQLNMTTFVSSYREF